MNYFLVFAIGAVFGALYTLIAIDIKETRRYDKDCKKQKRKNNNIRISKKAKEKKR